MLEAPTCGITLGMSFSCRKINLQKYKKFMTIKLNPWK